MQIVFRSSCSSAATYTAVSEVDSSAFTCVRMCCCCRKDLINKKVCTPKYRTVITSLWRLRRGCHWWMRQDTAAAFQICTNVIRVFMTVTVKIVHRVRYSRPYSCELVIVGTKLKPCFFDNTSLNHALSLRLVPVFACWTIVYCTRTEPAVDVLRRNNVREKQTVWTWINAWIHVDTVP